MNSSYVASQDENVRTSDGSAEVKKEKKEKTYFDYSLVFITVFLAVFGLIMIYSASSYIAQRDYNDASKFFKTQLISIVIGIVAMIFVAKIDYRKYAKRTRIAGFSYIQLLYVLCVFLQVFVLFFGRESHGKKRWIDLGFITFQPSELTKVAVILFVACWAQSKVKNLKSVSGFIAIILLNGPVLFLIARANLSTAIIVFTIIVGICFTASEKKLYYLVCGVIATGLVLVYIFFGSEGYRIERIAVWKNVDTEPKGYQILQGLYAIASGGIFGTGLGQSKQKLGFIPEAHNDMIFTVVCEELGMFGAVSLIALFIFMLYRIYIIALNAPDLFGSLICVGVFTHIAFQVVLNIAVVTNAVPSTGVPLPFISYGGTSISILMIEVGLVLGVSNQIKHYARN